VTAGAGLEAVNDASAVAPEGSSFLFTYVPRESGRRKVVQ
jgi:hypothetical protein